jgi:hypothetical protein
MLVCDLCRRIWSGEWISSDRRSVFDFRVIPSLVITSILTITSNQDFNNRRRQ